MSLVVSARASFLRRVARSLERGHWSGGVSRSIAFALAPLAERALARPAVVPEHVALVCVGGATLGGSGKTRVALACTRALAESGARVVLVGHAYRAAVRKPRIVSVHDALEDVGDEALACARALGGAGARCVIGPSRQSAIDHALRCVPDVLVLDGPLAVRTSGRRVLSLLAVDARKPWGGGRLPPAGDLRAPRSALLARADVVVPVEATPALVQWPDGSAEPLAALRARPVGLFTAHARPDRLISALESENISLREIVSIHDHGPLGLAERRIRQSRVEAWIATEKCALHLARVPLAVPLGVLRDDFRLPNAVIQRLLRLEGTGVRV